LMLHRLTLCFFILIMATKPCHGVEGQERSPSRENLKVNYSERRKFTILGNISYSILTIRDVQVAGQGIRGSVDYYPYRYLAIQAGYFTMPSESGELLMSGIDAAIKWYVFSPGAEIEIESSRVRINSYSHWTHYLLIGYRLRSLNFGTNQIDYSGPGYGYGVNWNIGKEFSIPLVNTMSINLELSFDSLTAASQNDGVSVINFSIGGGFIF